VALEAYLNLGATSSANFTIYASGGTINGRGTHACLLEDPDVFLAALARRIACCDN